MEKERRHVVLWDKLIVWLRKSLEEKGHIKLLKWLLRGLFLFLGSASGCLLFYAYVSVKRIVLWSSWPLWVYLVPFLALLVFGNRRGYFKEWWVDRMLRHFSMGFFGPVYLVGWFIWILLMFVGFFLLPYYDQVFFVLERELGEKERAELLGHLKKKFGDSDFYIRNEPIGRKAIVMLGKVTRKRRRRVLRELRFRSIEIIYDYDNAEPLIEY